MSRYCSVPGKKIDTKDTEISTHSQFILSNSSLHKIAYVTFTVCIFRVCSSDISHNNSEIYQNIFVKALPQGSLQPLDFNQFKLCNNGFLSGLFILVAAVRVVVVLTFHVQRDIIN